MTDSGAGDIAAALELMAIGLCWIGCSIYYVGTVIKQSYEEDKSEPNTKDTKDPK